MILAAGRGERMGDLTLATPKPLLKVNNRSLIEYSINALKTAGIHEIVINVSYRGEQIKTFLGNGEKWGVNIVYSEEPERLETGGGILQALPYLGDDPFIVISSDIITEFTLATLPKKLTGLAHLILTSNPSYRPNGDFGLDGSLISFDALPYFTYANVGLIHPDLFAQAKPGHFRLAEILFPAIRARKISGEVYTGPWFNIGTPADLSTVTLSA